MSELALVCAWCKTTIREGVPPISHGICPDCQEQWKSEKREKFSESGRPQSPAATSDGYEERTTLPASADVGSSSAPESTAATAALEDATSECCGAAGDDDLILSGCEIHAVERRPGSNWITINMGAYSVLIDEQWLELAQVATGYKAPDFHPKGCTCGRPFCPVRS